MLFFFFFKERVFYVKINEKSIFILKISSLFLFGAWVRYIALYLIFSRQVTTFMEVQYFLTAFHHPYRENTDS